MKQPFEEQSLKTTGKHHRFQYNIDLHPPSCKQFAKSFLSFLFFCCHRGKLILYEIQNIKGSPKKEKISLSGDKGSQWNCEKVTVEVSVKRQVKLRRICLNTVNWEAKKWGAQIRSKTSSLRVSRRSQGGRYWN